MQTLIMHKKYEVGESQPTTVSVSIKYRKNVSESFGISKEMWFNLKLLMWLCLNMDVIG